MLLTPYRLEVGRLLGIQHGDHGQRQGEAAKKRDQDLARPGFRIPKLWRREVPPFEHQPGDRPPEGDQKHTDERDGNSELH